MNAEKTLKLRYMRQEKRIGIVGSYIVSYEMQIENQ